MDARWCWSVLLGAVVASCTEELGEALDDAPVVGLPSPTQARSTEADRGCDGTPLPVCDGPFAGATCDLPCMPAAPRDAPLECGLDRYCHSNGSTYGLATRNAVLYPASPEDPDEVVQADLEAWIVEHPTDLGLADGMTGDGLALARMKDFRSSAGPLTMFRFAQTYRGIPVLAPDGIVTLVYGPQGAISVTGAIIDGRTPYEHADARANAAKAVHSIRVHADAHLPQASAQALQVVHVTPVAMPMRHAIGWAGSVRRLQGTPLARVIVDADPTFAGPVLPLVSFRELAASGLADTQPIELHSVDGTGDPTSLAYTDLDMLTTGAPLLGSTYGPALQLATERVVTLELAGDSVHDLAAHGARVLDPVGSFTSQGGAALGAQTAYHLTQSWYDYVDGRLSDPATGTKRWDSANLLYSNGLYPGDVPPGTYSPRVLVFSNTSSTDCPTSGVACVRASGYQVSEPDALAFPELVHIPPGASKREITGSVMLPGEGTGPITLAHEFGHIVDLFTGGGITADFAPDCGGCDYRCIAGTTDEAPPLSETLAQLLAFVLLRQAFDGVDWGQHCSIVDLVSRNGFKPWTPGPCIPAGEDISLFLRSDDCTKPSSLYCDRPEDVGVSRRCCFDDENLADCTLLVSDECPVGEIGPSGGAGTGTARPAPTGLCATSPGYSTNSLYQAFWQMLNGQHCEPTPPFACMSVSWAPGVAPMDAATDALLYAMRVNALTYDQLFDAMASYVSCTYGTAAHSEFNAVACAHGLRDCAAPAPMICETCGNGVREGLETCDGSDWLHASCEALPEYAGGTLTCDQSTCELDLAQCTMPGLDTTAGSMDEGESSTSTGTGVETETTVGATASDGCGCRSAGQREWLLALPLALLGGVRRRRAS